MSHEIIGTKLTPCADCPEVARLCPLFHLNDSRSKTDEELENHRRVKSGEAELTKPVRHGGKPGRAAFCRRGNTEWNPVKRRDGKLVFEYE